MKTILVDAVDTFVIEGQGVYQPMFELLEKFPNRKIIVTNADDPQIVPFSLTNLPYELFTLKHDPEAVKSAQSLGIESYYYDPEVKDLKALENFLSTLLAN